MRKNVCLKAVLRRPVLAVLLLLLIGSISFAFISRAVELVVVERENARIQRFYTASGKLERLDGGNGQEEPEGDFGPIMTGGGDSPNIEKIYASPGNLDVTDAAALVAASEYVAYQDVRRYTSAYLADITNADTGEGHHFGGPYPYSTGHTVFLFYGTVADIDYRETVKAGETVQTYRLKIEVGMVLAGYPYCVEQGKTVDITYSSDEYIRENADISGLAVGEPYLFFGHSWYWPLHPARYNLHLWPMYEDGPVCLPAPGDTVIDLDSPELAELKEVYELANANQHLVRITSTKNMCAIPNTAESAKMYYLAKGRWLNNEDETERRYVCTVEDEFARKNNLRPGDTIRLSFVEFPATYFGYITEPPDWLLDEAIIPGNRVDPRNMWFDDWRDSADWDNWQSWRDAETTEYIEFEIVGTYLKQNGYRLTESHDRTLIFIPDSCLPDGYGENPDGRIYDNQYSFVLKSATDEAAFIAEMGDKLAEAGVAVRFMENNVNDFLAAMSPVRQSTAFSVVVFAVVLVLALSLAVFIYLRQRRREFAILRALGMPKSRAVSQMLVPFLLIAAPGILGGGFLSWNYSQTKAARTLAFIKLNGLWTPMGRLPTVWLAVMVGAVMLLLTGFVLAGSAMVARAPALELLQSSGGGGFSRKRKMRKAEPVPEDTGAGYSAPLRLDIPPLAATGKPGVDAAGRHIFRHIMRAPLKSALTALVALFFVLALGWMGSAINRNEVQIEQLYQSTRIEGRFKNAYTGEEIKLTKNTARKLEGLEHIADLYLETEIPGGLIASAQADGSYDEALSTEDFLLCAVSRPEAFFVPSVASIEIEYAPGCDATMFELDWSESATAPVLLPAGMMRELGLSLGDSAFFVDFRRLAPQAEIIIAGQYTISGAAGTSSGQASPLVITPLSALNVLEQDMSRSPIYSKARIIVSHEYNHDLFAAQWEVGKVILNNIGMELFCEIDEGALTKVVKPMEKNLRLLKILYPVTIAVSSIIACGLAILLMLQSAREAAVMRVLGAPRRRVRLMLCAQQTALCVGGIATGLAALLLALGGVSAATPYLCAALYLVCAVIGSALSSIVITNRMPLELLQVKE